MVFVESQINKKYPRKSSLNWAHTAPVLRHKYKIFLVPHIQIQDENYRIILNMIIECFLRYGVHTCPSQESIAEWTGLSIRTVGTYLRLMHEEGIIEMGYRHMKTSLYKISPHLLESKKWWRLVQLLPALAAWFKGHLPTISYYRILYNKSYRYLKSKVIGTRCLNINKGEEGIKTGQCTLNLHSGVSNSARIINHARIINSAHKGENGMKDLEIILESVLKDRTSVGGFLTPLALACGKKLGFNCYVLAGLLGVPDEILKAAYASVMPRLSQISNPRAYFFATIKKLAQEKGIVLDFEASRRVQMRMVDYQNQANDFQYEDDYNLPNENPKPAAYLNKNAQHNVQQNAPVGPRKGSYVDGDEIIKSNPNWPSHMKIGFIPKGMKGSGKVEFEKWAADRMYPWKKHPDLGEMFEAGYDISQIEEFLRAELADWISIQNLQKERLTPCAISLLGSVFTRPSEMIEKLNSLLEKISRSEKGVLPSPKNQQEGIKNDLGETKQGEVVYEF